MDDNEFAQLWNKAASIDEVLVKSGMESRKGVVIHAAALRRKGFVLRKFSKNARDADLIAYRLVKNKQATLEEIGVLMRITRQGVWDKIRRIELKNKRSAKESHAVRSGGVGSASSE